MKPITGNAILVVGALVFVLGCDDGPDNLNAEYSVHPMRAETELEAATTVKQIDAAIEHHVTMMKEIHGEMFNQCREYKVCPEGAGISTVRREDCEWKGDVISPEDMLIMKENEQNLIDLGKQQKAVCEQHNLSKSDCIASYKDAAIDQIIAFEKALNRIDARTMTLKYETLRSYCVLDDEPVG